MGIAAQQGQSKDWNLGWSPKLYPYWSAVAFRGGKREAQAPIPPRHCPGGCGWQVPAGTLQTPSSVS